MQVCQNCGEAIEPDQSFCKNCGAKINSNPSPSPIINPNTETQTRSNTQKQAVLSARMKWAIAVVMVLAVSLFGIHTYLSNLYKAEKTIGRFEQAVKQADYTTLRKILTQDGAKIDVTDKELAAYVAFLKKDKNLNQIVDELNQAAVGMKEYKKITPVTDHNNNNLLKLEKGSMLLGIYQQYVINVYPFTIRAESNADNTDIYMNGEKTKHIKNSGDAVTIGNYLPGEYTLKALYKDDYVSLNSQKKVDFSNAENNKITTRVDLNGHFVSVYSNGDGAEIYANGKNTGKKVGKIDSFGPVPIDGSLELYGVLNRDGGPIKSSPVKITGDGAIYLEFKEIADEEKKMKAKQAAQEALNQYGGDYNSTQEKMQSFMNDYLSTSVEAINARNFNLVVSYLSQNGKQYTEAKDYINYVASKGITESLLNLTVQNVESTDSGYKVKTREEYTIYYGDGSLKDKTFESNYTLIGDQAGLKILTLDSTNTLSSIDMSNGTYN